jgi:hypothetical protein
MITVATTIGVRATLARLGVLDGRGEAVMQQLFFYQTVKGSLTWITARALIIVSMCALPLMHGLMPQVPFALDIPMHIAYLVSNVRYMSAPMADVFTRPKYATATREICAILAALPTRHAFFPTPPDSSPTAGPCGVQHVWLVILFFQLSVGFFLPLYVSYTMERRLKLRYVQHELQYELQARRAAAAAAAAAAAPTTTAAFVVTAATSSPVSSAAVTATTTTITSTTPNPKPLQTAAATTTIITATNAILAAARQQWMRRAALASTFLSHPLVGTAGKVLRRIIAPISGAVHVGRDTGPIAMCTLMLLSWALRCCLQICMLGLLAVLSWQLVVELQRPVARHVSLLQFPGAQYGWYWELVCGSDGPCCPA